MPEEKVEQATPGLSFDVGLEEVENSPVPGVEGVSHVHGPRQAAADPIAAGLDVEGNPGSLKSGKSDANVEQQEPATPPAGPDHTEPASPPDHPAPPAASALPEHEPGHPEVEKHD